MDVVDRSRRTWIVACCAIAAGGCGDPASDPSFDQVIDAIAAFDCGAIADCCGERGLPALNVSECSRVDGALTRDFLSPSGGAVYDPEEGRACLRELDRREPSCAARNVPEPCLDLSKGTLAPGESCERSNECRGNRDRTASCDFYTHRCVSDPHGNEGDACTGTCVQEPDSLSCQGGPYPFPTPTPASAVLAEPRMPSAASELATCFLNDGLYCSSGACTRTVPNGEPCESGLACGEGSWCHAGRCSPPSGSGEPCAVDQRATCESGLWCDGATCVPPLSEGEPCGAGPCAVGLYCGAEAVGERAVCTRLKGPGEPCHEFSSCKEGFCDLELGCSDPVGAACRGEYPELGAEASFLPGRRGPSGISSATPSSPTGSPPS